MTPSPAPTPAHEHVWTRCPNCPAGDGPCACSGVACCDQERAEIAAEAAAPTPVGAPGWLAEAKRLVAKRERLAKKLYSGGGGADTVAALSAVNGKLAELSPALVAALEAVLAAHPPQVTANGKEVCPNCTRDQSVFVSAERCLIRVAIASALRDAQGGAG